MKNKLKIASITAFVLAIPSLIVIDWFYKGAGIGVMFFFITTGLVFDQILRLQYPSVVLFPIQNYRKNKILNIFALILFVQSPIALIYFNKMLDKLGLLIMLIMISFGIILNQISIVKFQYSAEKGE